MNTMNNSELKTYRLIVKGKVQNVGFRHWFSNLAISLGLNGYVQNKQSKDEVEAIIQGDMQSILSLTEKAKLVPSVPIPAPAEISPVGFSSTSIFNTLN